ncbi:MAG TPA: hypothetical protein VI728_13230 [Syntrophales bacterium]|nr:hypothetical protein [Syntrophales bacterium]
MPRVTVVKKAQKTQGECGRCNAKIEKGDAYKWWIKLTIRPEMRLRVARKSI